MERQRERSKKGGEGWLEADSREFFCFSVFFFLFVCMRCGRGDSGGRIL
jgi:hypothetical protein